jgi:hydroxymethylglutaryl-CoA reductase
MKNTLAPDFSQLSPKERMRSLKNAVGLTAEEVEILEAGKLGIAQADKMIENVVGTIPVPIGIATNFIVNGREILVPMGTEERSVISAASRAAGWARSTGGFKAHSAGSVMIGQVQVLKVRNHALATRRVLAGKQEVLAVANAQSSTRKAVDLRVKELMSPSMLVVELLVDVRDSIGANVVDSMCEAVAPLIETLTGGKVNLRIVSNLATERMVSVEATVKKDTIGGDEVVKRIVSACAFAEADPYRAATQNKETLDGVSAVLVATANDFRAVAAGAHAFAALSGTYRPLSSWKENANGDLEGRLEMPMAVGTVGGSVSSHPTAAICLRILGVKRAAELAEIAASVGLACGLSALHSSVSSSRKT